MAPTTATYVGLVVAGLIFLWAILEISRRFLFQKRRDSQRKNTWVDFRPHTAVDPEDSFAPPNAESEQHPATLQSRAQQNGHYSKSKKTH